MNSFYGFLPERAWIIGRRPQVAVRWEGNRSSPLVFLCAHAGGPSGGPGGWDANLWDANLWDANLWDDRAEAMFDRILVALGWDRTSLCRGWAQGPLWPLPGKWPGAWEAVRVLVVLGDERRAPSKIGKIEVFTTYGPPYLLKTPLAKREAWIDLQMAAKRARGERR